MLRRLVRQWAVAARMDVLLVLRSKSQAAVWAVTDVIAYTANFGAVLLLAQRFGGIAGWSKAELIFLFGFATTAAGLRQMMFGYNVASISRRIGRGQLDHSLVQPQPLALSFATEGFSPVSGIYGVTPGIGLLVAGAALSHVAVTPAFVGKLVICLVASMTTVLAASFAIGAAAFWAPRGAEEISMRADSLLALTDFPLDPLPTALRTVLLTAVPAGFVAWFPASALLGRRPPSDWVLSPVVALVAALVAIAIFRKGLRHYARTGSSRYTDFGHRR
jgi:ABC-2 type transport system permease protein